MSWAQHHEDSERYAAEAELSLRAGDRVRAVELYTRAAEAENLALQSLDPSKTRTLGITAVSAVALYYKAALANRAEHFAYQLLASGQLPEFATESLKTLLQTIWSDQVRQGASARFSSEHVLVAVKGGEVLHGAAPLDLILQKVETVHSLFVRVTEFLKNVPHRKRGPATEDILQRCRPWLFQAAPGSYQFEVAIEEAAQRSLWETDPDGRLIATTFLNILRATAEDPDGVLIRTVPDPDYRGTFLKLSRSLAPTGSVFSTLEVRSLHEPRPISLVPEVRRSIGESIHRQFPRQENPQDTPVRLAGILRALHLDKDWLELTTDSGPVRVDNIDDAIDDVVGPMVNHRVSVEAVRTPRGKYKFRDIQSAD